MLWHHWHLLSLLGLSCPNLCRLIKFSFSAPRKICPYMTNPWLTCVTRGRGRTEFLVPRGSTKVRKTCGPEHLSLPLSCRTASKPALCLFCPSWGPKEESKTIEGHLVCTSYVCNEVWKSPYGVGSSQRLWILVSLNSEDATGLGLGL